jgi:ubiquinone/menaquinone biosynthesis C-methylase UbiE
MPDLTYDDIADWYDAWIDEGALAVDSIYTATRALLGDVSDLYICDLACGQGRISRALAREGAAVWGIDRSARLIDIARRLSLEEPNPPQFLEASASNLSMIPDERFDGVLCHMALMDIEELQPSLREVRRILVPNGWFVFSLLHPCFHTSNSGELTTDEGVQRIVGRYFAEGFWISPSRTGPPGRVGAYHRSISTYLNALLDEGLVLERVAEPQLTGEDAMRRPVWQEVPVVFIGRCRKR